jgi:hypothetical protein
MRKLITLRDLDIQQDGLRELGIEMVIIGNEIHYIAINSEGLRRLEGDYEL